MDQNIISPKATRATRKRVKKVLEEQQKPGLTESEKEHIKILTGTGKVYNSMLLYTFPVLILQVP